MQSNRIDVHAHFLPSFYREALVSSGHSRPDGMAAIPDWSEAGALDMMDSLNIASAILSISSPGVHFGDDEAARRLARRVNEEAARLSATHAGRFGWFAATPLPDVQGAIDEAIYALDGMAADGIGVESNHHGMYLGDQRLESFYRSLDDRRAILFIHPTSPSCTGCGSLALGYPAPMLEFMFETTRTITSMVLSGVTRRYPNIRIIVPHAGAALPVLASRVDFMVPYFQAKSADKSPTLTAELRKLYFDLAGAPLPELFDSLLQIADPDRILFGSDWPFTATTMCADLTSRLDNQIDPARLEGFMSGNARKLFPRFTGE